MAKSSEFEWHDTKEVYDILAARFDVNAARRLIERRPREVIDIDVSKAPADLHRITDERKAKADLSFPLILITTPEGLWVIDGWHRIAKAQAEGIRLLPGVVLTMKESQRVSCRPWRLARSKR